MLDGLLPGLRWIVGGGLSSIVDKLSNHEGPLFKMSGIHGDEVHSSRRPALAPFVVTVGGLPLSLEPTYFYSIHMDKYKNSSGPRGAVDQALETSPSGRDGVVQAKTCTFPAVDSQCERRIGSVVDSCFDTLMIINVYASMSYRAIHSVLKPFGTVLRIRLKYDGDCLSNRYHVTFTSDVAARAAIEAINFLRLGGNNLTAEVKQCS